MQLLVSRLMEGWREASARGSCKSRHSPRVPLLSAPQCQLTGSSPSSRHLSYGAYSKYDPRLTEVGAAAQRGVNDLPKVTRGAGA